MVFRLYLKLYTMMDFIALLFPVICRTSRTSHNLEVGIYTTGQVLEGYNNQRTLNTGHDFDFSLFKRWAW